MTAVVQRSTNYTVAAVLNLVTSVVSIVFSMPALIDGADATNSSGDQPPYIVMVLGFAIGVAGLISTYGVWKVQRWGVVLTIVINALNFLSAIPGIPFAPTLWMHIAATASCVVSALIIWLLLRRRKAMALAGVSA